MTFSEPTSPFSEISEPAEQSNRPWSRIFTRLLGKDEPYSPSHEKENQPKPSLSRRLSRKVVPGLPRPPTFKRQNSEKRDPLLLVNDNGEVRRAQSLDRRQARKLLPFSSTNYELASLPTLPPSDYADPILRPISGQNDLPSETIQPQIRPMPPSTPPLEPDNLPHYRLPASQDNTASADIVEQIVHELEDKWILNLSMHFRDNSPREKFFVTYAETLTKWRRITVSCDYRDAPPDSLEQDLQGLTYQRDKNTRIYEAIRNSLPDIQFYDTVTNLRLQTGQDDRLHVHVTEDVNEIIAYPSTAAVKHLDYTRVDERDVAFDSHLSGFVYKVNVNNEAFNGKTCVKKEIPGPDSVEEFLYEINALNALVGTSNVVQFEGLVVDEENDQVKGLLISYANQGPLVDLIYDYKNTGSFSWERKEKWARQMIYGLAAIHEAGFVQGDCTLSNIVIDEYDDALIIDINRRGCPVGWEPPEIQNMIDSGHRISMYIGVKSDLFQLGMSLWALITEEDEPERQTRPLKFTHTRDIPDDKKYLLEVAKICLSERPKDRLSAERLLSFFPKESSPFTAMIGPQSQDGLTRITMDRDTVYIEPGSYLVEEETPTQQLDHDLGRSAKNFRTGAKALNSLDGAHVDSRSLNLVCGSRESTLDVDPLVVSISSNDDSKLTGNIYGFDTNEEDEAAAQRMLRRRQRKRSKGDVPKSKTLDEENDDILRDLGHIDSGLDADMQIDTRNALKTIRILDHIDSGLADMDLGLLDSNDLARRKLDSMNIEQVNTVRTSPRHSPNHSPRKV